MTDRIVIIHRHPTDPNGGYSCESYGCEPRVYRPDPIPTREYYRAYERANVEEYREDLYSSAPADVLDERSRERASELASLARACATHYASVGEYASEDRWLTIAHSHDADAVVREEE